MDVPVELLRCPITGQSVTRVPEDLLRILRQHQHDGKLHTRSGECAEPFEGGLLTTDGAWLYPIRSGIPVMLACEAIAAAER